ncbi:MAG: methyltransferase domain-containing protein [Erysipelotrichia bacterium]|nr:methyltransferase domain-containing protein [Erysipelotrichia bacterium]NCC54070.1 methyltransferase domain-containing protein [Erysipelotrichia bacterium]
MEEKELTLDYIHGTNTYVYQRKDMFKVNSDTAQLARFMRIKKGERVLDVGTNNGALLLHAAQFLPSYLCGVDIQKEACELALYNMEKNNIRHVDIVCCDFKQFKQSGFDVVLCNPPYFSSDHHRQPQMSMRSIARHEYFLAIEPLMQNVAYVLKEGGRLYMVHRANRISDIVELSRKYKLEIKTLQFVYDTKKSAAIAVLVEAIKGAGNDCRVLEPIYL